MRIRLSQISNAGASAPRGAPPTGIRAQLRNCGEEEQENAAFCKGNKTNVYSAPTICQAPF